MYGTKKNILRIFLLAAGICAACAGISHAADNLPAETKTTYPPGSAWTLSYPLGQHLPSYLDTLSLNYQRQAIPSLSSDAYVTTGNLGAEGETLIFFQRKPGEQFFFADALRTWLPTAYRQKFYNVFIPMTLLSYNTGGNKENVQDRLRATFAANLNRRFGFTASLDYLYSKGAYSNQAVKDFVFGFGAYYAGDRYDVQAYYNQYNMLNKENGGITDDLYITDPGELQGGVDKIEPRSIPTRLSSAHSRLAGSHFFLNQAYKIGYWTERQVNDTLIRKEYVPVTKFIHTLEFKRNRHVFDNRDADQAANFWENRYISEGFTHDRTLQWELANTLGITTVEGFKPWAKFALGAYITYSHIHTRQTSVTPEGEDLTPLPFSIPGSHGQNLLWIGGQLSKTSGQLITYSADAKFGIAGDVAADLDIRGEIGSRFRMLGDTVQIKAYGSFRNTAQPYLLQKYVSNHFVWNNDFGKTRDFRISGKLTIPWTRTQISAGVANIQNMVYFGPDALPRQNGGNVQVVYASLEQKLKAGIWHWDNSITYQTSTDQSCLPLPVLTIYSNMYVHFKAFRVLDLQLGVDCDYFTRYNALGYQPATMSFHTTDNGSKAGNYAWCDLYASCKLYKVRFFVLWSHFNQGMFSKNYFSMPGYPLNPRKFQLGLSIDFAN